MEAYPADPIAVEILFSEGVEDYGNYVFLEAPGNPDTAIIFYPGAKVEAEAYLPLLDDIRKNLDISTVLVRMPFYMAIFDVDRADIVIKDLDEVEKWYIAGHSMGGAMASYYAVKNQDKVEGLILLGAYPYGEYPLVKPLTVFGSLDELAVKKVDYTLNVVKIEGGNHAQFGNYGRQKGDPDATIPAEMQQRIAVEAIKTFINRHIYDVLNVR